MSEIFRNKIKVIEKKVMGYFEDNNKGKMSLLPVPSPSNSLSVGVLTVTVSTSRGSKGSKDER